MKQTGTRIESSFTEATALSLIMFDQVDSLLPDLHSLANVLCMFKET